MTTSRLMELTIVVAMFLGYIGLWRAKRQRSRQHSGVDPDVLAKASTPVQSYFARLLGLLTIVAVATIAVHASALDAWPPLVRVAALDCWGYDLLGGAAGLAGLLLCGVAQSTMGTSWRVGIDVDRHTQLVTLGVFRWVRNPTYLGLYLVHLGLWWIWPTTLVAAYAFLFFIVMEIQVRCEEEFLLEAHGDAYIAYMAKTWRYIPHLY